MKNNMSVFENLEYGDIFKYNNEVFVKSHILPPDGFEDMYDEYECSIENAVSLVDGRTCCFDDDDEVEVLRKPY